MQVKIILSLFILILISTVGCSQSKNKKAMKFKELTPEEERVIIYKGTEAPYSGKYEKFEEKGTYVCKRCGASLYLSDDKFDANCGWPSFDKEIPGAIKRIPDADGMRTEIECAKCGAHLGHVFTGEHFTPKNTRHCVNSISLDFVPVMQVTQIKQTQKLDTAIFAGGCFWGVEYYMHKSPGVISVKSGYTGGHKDHPTYKEVCSGTTGHIEAVEIIYDPAQTNYEILARLFFEIHDPTQLNHQGPDYGEQYQSAVFYRNDEQKQIAEKLISLLKKNGFNVVTQVRKASTFWIAEDYHQEYYEHKGSTPYCHGYVKRF
jgi:peptide methionine sulfoxide reductase msrA/msrB